MRIRTRVAVAALFAVTGIATFINVWQYAVWAIWGRQTHATELASLLGSLGLIVAAVITLRWPRLGARVAIAGLVANWSFFAYAIPTLAEQELVKQRIEVVFVRWTQGPQPLTVGQLPSAERAPLPQGPLTETDLQRLSSAGLSGTVSVSGSAVFGEGDRARVLVVMSRQLATTPVELKQPDRTDGIYLQDGSDWRRVPAEVRLSRLGLRLEIASHTRLQTWYSLELPDGARVGGTAFIWPAVLAQP